MSFTQLVAACSQVQAETLYMNFVLELTHEEIALVTNRPLGTVKSHINRGKAAIKAALEVDSVDPLPVQLAGPNKVIK